MVIVVLGIFAAYTAGSLYSPAEMSLPSQARRLASDIDKAKTLAYTTGKRMRVIVSGGGAANATYNVACVTLPTPCATDTLPVKVEKGVVLAGPANLYINSFGQPIDSAGSPLVSATTYTLSCPSLCTSTETITVAAVTGTVTVSP